MIAHKVILTESAQKDLFDIYSYVAVESSFEIADNLIQLLKNACQSLTELPNRGRIPHEFEFLNVSDYLEIHCKEYRIIYEVVANKVTIYCIIHMKRDVYDLLKERLLS